MTSIFGALAVMKWMRKPKQRLGLGLIAGMIASAATPALAVPGIDELEIGYLYGHRTYDDKPVHNKPYVYARSTYELFSSDKTGATLTFNWGFRAWRDLKDQEVQPKSLSIAYSQSFLKLELGFQEIPWGETFGMYIADLVNPRDFRDPLLNDPSWYRLPVFAAQAQFFLGPLTLQLLAVPVPRSNQYPNIGTTSDLSQDLKKKSGLPQVEVLEPASFRLEDVSKNFEAGGKASTLFDFGLDLGVFYLLHWNRNLVYDASVRASPTPTLVLTPVQQNVDSYGVSASQAFENFVFRGDLLWHRFQPLQMADLSPHITGNQVRGIAGVDYSWEMGGGKKSAPIPWTLGAQYHYDETTLQRQQWVSARVTTRWFNEKIEPEFFIFRGVGNEDTWVQPKINWLANANLTLGLRADFVDGSEEFGKSAVFGLTNEDRILATLTCKF